MEKPERQDTNTGKSDGQTPILASADQGTAGQLKPALTKSELASIETAAGLLALLQNDCSELQSVGLKVAILARDNKLYLVLDYPGRKLEFDTGNGHILLEGVPVLKLMEAVD